MNDGLEVILYVADQARSRAFYELALGRGPVLDGDIAAYALDPDGRVIVVATRGERT